MDTFGKKLKELVIENPSLLGSAASLTIYDEQKTFIRYE